MTIINKTYEAMVVFSLNQGEEQVKTLVQKFSDMMSAVGTVESVDEWGKRKLAYEIDDQWDAYYVLYTFNAPTDFPAELDRVLKITEGVIRSLITVK